MRVDDWGDMFVYFYILTVVWNVAEICVGYVFTIFLEFVLHIWVVAVYMLKSGPD